MKMGWLRSEPLAVFFAAALSASGCASQVQYLPAVSLDPMEAFKVVRSSVDEGECWWSSFGGNPSDDAERVHAILARIRKLDEEALYLRNGEVSTWTASLWILSYRCVSLRGQAGRGAPSINVPMNHDGGHEHHH